MLVLDLKRQRWRDHRESPRFNISSSTSLLARPRTQCGQFRTFFLFFFIFALLSPPFLNEKDEMERCQQMLQEWYVQRVLSLPQYLAYNVTRDIRCTTICFLVRNFNRRFHLVLSIFLLSWVFNVRILTLI